ncbi:DNA-protecting protein DprA [Nocardiopsis dassonvillei]|uniref:DNA-processing protein DprA n=1 Tax=Nocardiopsis dassonvillei TaxID=2014 RepID=UPI0020A4DB83|nr:DNA-processing protein DprA [Nocardiopsis dassonvillei]MCP3013838.1 DNA-protecting protein DprA [Nocardiopsis dassonvillei]
MMEQQPPGGGGSEPGPIQEPLPLAPEPTETPPFAVALLALAEISGVGHQALRTLVNAYGDKLGHLLVSPPEQIVPRLRALKAPTALIESLTRSAPDLLDRASEHERRLAKQNVHLLSPAQLPTRLAQLPDGPRWLFVQGDPAALSDGPHVAIVGTREATPAGIEATNVAVRLMASYPITLVSGLANGVDAAAHARALDFGLRNVAFLGHGINLVFPAETKHLRERIIEQGGAVVSEYLPNDRYRKQQFVQRNRLQAGQAEAVIVTEGQASGGTAHTVRFAARYHTPIIGLTWPGVGDLVKVIADTPGGQIIDIFDAFERRQLDALLRALTEQHGHPAYPLKILEDMVAWEFAQRDLRPEDVKRLLDTIRRLPKGRF